MICAKGSNADNRFKIGIKKQKKTARCIKVQNSVGHSTDLHIPAQAFWLWSYVTKLPALLHISFIYSLLRVLFWKIVDWFGVMQPLNGAYQQKIPIVHHTSEVFLIGGLHVRWGKTCICVSNYSLGKLLKINKAMLAMAFLLCSFTQAEVNKS